MPSSREYVFEPNPLFDPAAVYGKEQRAILDDDGFGEAWQTISSWPGYAPTPLVPLAGIARHAGIDGLFYKDESSRFGLGSFKALGGAYAVSRVVSQRAVDGRPAEITVCCATDGNHGRSVAWGAQMFGCRCVIFIHSTVSEARKQEIEKFGARVVRTKGNYDDSVRLAQETAAREGWTVVSDTSYPGYVDVPRYVMQGYEIMAAEAFDQWPRASTPTHVFLQTGVGGLAAAVTAYAWRRLGENRPLVVLVDPLRSSCWLDSIRNQRPTPVDGPLDTVMAGLACGEVSILAWSVLKHVTHSVIAISDEAAVDGMRLLAEGRWGDRPMVAGESAVAGLIGLLAATKDEKARAALRLDGSSRILVFGTEGATDPGLYKEIVGVSADAVQHREAMAERRKED